MISSIATLPGRITYSMLHRCGPVLALMIILRLAAAGQAGTPDPTFGINGVAIYDLPSPQIASWFNVVALPDTTAIVCGWYRQTSGQHWLGAFSHILEDGSIDTNWGTNGYTLFDTGQTAIALDVLIAADGRIFGAGYRTLQTAPVNYAGVIFCLLPDGTPDTSFSGNGIAIFPQVKRITNIKQQPDGKLVATLGASFTEGYNWILRCSLDGALDSTFSDDGILGDSTRTFDFNSLDLLDDGTIIAGGSHDTTILGDFIQTPAVMRVDEFGELDPAFGSNGMVVGGFISGQGAVGSVRATGPSFYAVGRHGASLSQQSGFLTWFLDDGTLDPGFNAGTAVIIDLDTVDEAGTIEVQDDGKLLIFGASGLTWSTAQIFVSRFEPNGSMDVGYGSIGHYLSTLPLPILDYRSAIMADGKALVVGRLSNANGFAIRLLADGPTSAQRPAGDEMLLVYPNPLRNGELFVEPSMTGAGRVELFDGLGRRAAEQDGEYVDAPLTIDVSSLSNGHYLLVVRSNGSIMRSAVVIDLDR